jgi:hypothetical protein
MAGSYFSSFSGYSTGYRFWIIKRAEIKHNKEKIMPEEKVRTEEFQVRGEEIISKIKELIHEGDIRRIIIKNDEGRTLIDIPLTIGVVGALVAPQLAALGAIAALVTHGTIVVEKVEE